ncbi:MAG TPA: cytochrome c-type biogenesis protein CcmH [Gemmatimonadales bacterium]|jgi:cytochrome c-type biogenesis protein CcmH/NrfF|nr:cytochrome c-type biogenesis protein CcmH [Gemmatimonadales bacterium]
MTPGRQDATLHVARRDFLTLGVSSLFGVLASWRLGAVQDSLAGSGPAGRVFDPRWAGRSMTPLTAADTDAALQVIEKRLKCSCGCGLDIYTCRTTDFNCTYSPALHRQVVALAQQGKTDQEIIDAFVAEYGQQVLMAPPKRGFNLAGYFIPALLVLVAAGFLIRAMRRWTRAAAAETASAPAPGEGLDASPAELERLRRELGRLPS